MVSFRFPFSFSQPPKPKSPNAANSNFSKRSFSDNFAVGTVAVAGVGAGIAAGIVLSQISSKPFVENPLNFLLSSLNRNHFSPAWGSLTLADSSAPVTESRTGMSFPSVLKDSQRLLGTGVRRKAILGLKNIDVYAFGTAFNLLMFFSLGLVPYPFYERLCSIFASSRKIVQRSIVNLKLYFLLLR